MLVAVSSLFVEKYKASSLSLWSQLALLSDHRSSATISRVSIRFWLSQLLTYVDVAKSTHSVDLMDTSMKVDGWYPELCVGWVIRG